MRPINHLLFYYQLWPCGQLTFFINNVFTRQTLQMFHGLISHMFRAMPHSLLRAAVRQHGLGHTPYTRPFSVLTKPFTMFSAFHFFSFSAFHFFSFSFFQPFPLFISAFYRVPSKCASGDSKCASGGSKCAGTVPTLLVAPNVPEQFLYTSGGSKCAGTVPTLLVAPNVPEQFLHFWWLQMCRNSSYTSGTFGATRCVGTVPAHLECRNFSTSNLIKSGEFGPSCKLSIHLSLLSFTYRYI